MPHESSRSTPRRAGSGARVAWLREAVAAELWPVPVLAVVVAVAAGLAMTHLDQTVAGDLAAGVRSVVFDGDADTARSVLSAILGALVTATSLTFSLTLVALQLASSQATPRLLRTFAGDGAVHATLAVFVGTFAYTLTVLRTVRDAEGVETFVPRLSITLGFALAVVSMLTLVLFLAHVVTQLRVETMLREVHDDVLDAVAVLEREREAEDAEEQPLTLDGATRTLHAPRGGFVTGIDRSRLLVELTRHDARMVEHRAVGDHVVEGSALATVEPGGDPEPAEADRLMAGVLRCYRIDYERTVAGDHLHGVQQTVDIALRALSPGVNDPTTAVNSIGHLASVLVRLRDLPPPSPALLGADGVARLAPCRSGFTDAARLALAQIRRYGASDFDTAAAVLGLLAEVACTPSGEPPRAEVRQVLLEQAEAFEEALAATAYVRADRDRLDAALRRVREALAGVSA